MLIGQLELGNRWAKGMEVAVCRTLPAIKDGGRKQTS